MRHHRQVRSGGEGLATYAGQTPVDLDLDDFALDDLGLFFDPDTNAPP